MTRGEHMTHGYDQNEKVYEGGRDEQHDYCARGIALESRRPGREERERPYACIKSGRHRQHRAGPQNWLLALGPGGLAWLACGQTGGGGGGGGGPGGVGPPRGRPCPPP